jgi:hypothetical protein
MKIRKGFVSNSSSSSFMIEKDHLTSEQIDKIKRHSEFGEEYDEPYSDYAWQITETNHCLKGETSMDNFDMDSFMKKIGVDTENIFWGYR